MSKLYNPIAIYNYNKKKYFIALDNNKIVSFKYENGEITDDYSKEELEVFLEVYNSIKINKEAAVNLGLKKINGKVFETFYDIEKELYFWYESVDGERKTPSKYDLEYLNYRYNNTCLKVADDEKNSQDDSNEIFDWKEYEEQQAKMKEMQNKKDIGIDISGEPTVFDWATDPSFAKAEKKERAKTFFRGLKQKGQTIAIVLVSGMSLVTFSDAVLHTNLVDNIKSKFGEKSYTDEVKYEEVENIEYDFQEVTNAIDLNPNLGEGEKQFFKNFKEYFDQCGQYMDLNVILDRISKLKITYTTEECKAPTIAGEYDTVENSITIYSTDGFENCDKAVLAHEFLHVTQKGFSKRLTMELSNEEATREQMRALVENGILNKDDYKNDYDVPVYGNGYDQCMKVYYLLANLLDQDTIRKYQAIPADTIISNALMEIEEKSKVVTLIPFDRGEMDRRALSLLDEIDELRDAPDTYGYRTVDYSDEKYKKICEKLDFYYQIKFNKSIDECFVEDIMSFDNTYGQINTSTAKGAAIWEVMLKELKDRVDKLDPTYEIPMGEYRYVLPRTYFSDKHQNPIVYFNTYQKLSQFEANGFFLDVEITPEIEEAYAEELEKAKINISKNEEESKTETTADNAGGMGSRDVERE